MQHWLASELSQVKTPVSCYKKLLPKKFQVLPECLGIDKLHFNQFICTLSSLTADCMITNMTVDGLMRKFHMTSVNYLLHQG